MEEKIKISTFKDLYAWQEGHKLVLIIYGISKKFPGSEIYNLTSQMRRSAVSITSNIAEGFSRKTDNDKCQFYTISHASLTELENQIIIAKDLNYINDEEYKEILGQMIIVSKLINGLKKIKNKKL
ncbi:MAG: four helix bundle protein [bacterium]